MISKLKSLVFTSILFFSVHQLNGQSTHYKILENNPGNKSLLIGISPFDVNGYSPDISIGWAIRTNWMMNKFLQVDLDIRNAYLDINQNGVYSPDGLKKAHWYQAGAAFNFRTRTLTKPVKVVLQHSRGSKYEHITYIRVPSEVKRISSVHGGVMTILNNHFIENDFTRNLQEDDIQGKTLQGDVVYFRDTINYESINYVANSTGIYGGLNFRSIRDLLIQTDSYGEKSTRVLSDFYLDFLFTPLVHYSLRPNSKQSMFKDIDISIPENKKKLLGWRVGYSYASGKTVGFTAKIEAGQQPGIPGNGFFMNVGMGMSIRALGNK